MPNIAILVFYGELFRHFENGNTYCMFSVWNYNISLRANVTTLILCCVLHFEFETCDESNLVAPMVAVNYFIYHCFH